MFSNLVSWGAGWTSRRWWYQVLVFGGLYEALVVLAGYLIVNLVFGNILEPRIMGRGLDLSTLVVSG
ncbi:AI-2E family transporter, partial [Klebsiella pneumoniae]